MGGMLQALSANKIGVQANAAHMNKDVQFAYRLNDKPNTFATQAGSRGTVMLTFGIKL